ncbi:MAG: HAD family hydrolase [Acidobacteria bacterium]|nr:MAG: HAD family hydrolase [Acidobacteriota bacterium]
MKNLDHLFRVALLSLLVVGLIVATWHLTLVHKQTPEYRYEALAAGAGARVLHDFDYEMFPSADQHPFTGANILCGRGYSERFIKAIMGHATYTNVPRDTDMAKALFATDELCGFLVACALVRPSRSLDDMEVKSVRKKLKDKAFARSVNRDDIYQGAQELGVELDDHIRFVIDSLKPVQKEIGLGRAEEQTNTA